MVRHQTLLKLWHGIYSVTAPDTELRLRALDILFECRVIACLHTAAELYGFDVDGSSDVHVIDPFDRHRPRRPGLFVHQRDGAPTSFVGSRIATEPAWTAVELARSLRRPRALATLDAATGSGLCFPAQLATAAERQAGRRGIVGVRSLLPLVDGRAESPMESESRLLMIDSGLPAPDLQHAVLDEWGLPKFFLDFAWLEQMIGAEYDGDEFHGAPANSSPALRRTSRRPRPDPGGDHEQILKTQTAFT